MCIRDRAPAVEVVRTKNIELKPMDVEEAILQICLLYTSENVLVGLSNKQPSNFFASLLRLPKYYSSEEELKDKAMKLLAIFNLDGEADTLAKNLAYGQQRHLEIVRALATEPKILFLDEPAAGIDVYKRQTRSYCFNWTIYSSECY